jgi:histidinol dehydrogenase
VRVEQAMLGSDPAAAAAAIRATTEVAPEVEATVREIVDRVRHEGDAAVRELTAHFDTGGAPVGELRVGEATVSAAYEAVDPALRAALELAAVNVRDVAAAGVDQDREVELRQGQRVRVRELPVQRAAVYVPGGRAPYPSTVIMGAITARVAGVAEVVVCCPPGPDGRIHDAVLAASAIATVSELYAVGGAQGVAALALGTDSIPSVDVVVGPGNVYVQEAKRQLAHRVGIDGFAGPSELVVLFGDDADTRLVALDLAAQAEHGADSPVIGISSSAAAIEGVAGALEELRAEGSVPDATVRLFETGDLEAALAFAEAFAPEHLELIGAAAEGLAPRVRAAGCLFVGASGATAFGDYVAGSNHVLPTGGAARFASALSPRHFRRRMAEVRLPAAGEGLAELARAGSAIANAEGFVLHARSMEVRVRENGRP